MKLNLKHIILSSFLLLAVQLLVVAQDSLKLNTLSTISSVGADMQGNYYVGDVTHTLYKIDKTGKILTNVNVKTYGAISQIDCSNPFEIYSFHKDQNIVVYYDNMLNTRGETRLNDFYYTGINCIARSYNNGIWFFDQSQYKLLNINKKGKVLASSNNISAITESQINPIQIVEFNNKVFLCDSSIGIIEFDIYGTYITTYYMKGITSFYPSQVHLYLTKDSSVIKYHKLTRDFSILDSVNARFQICGAINSQVFGYNNNYILSFAAD